MLNEAIELNPPQPQEHKRSALTRPPRAVKAARHRRRWFLAVGLPCLLGALWLWQGHWRHKGSAPPPQFKQEWTAGILAAVIPAWPKQAPRLILPLRSLKATKISILATEPLGGEWAVAYLMEAPLGGGARVVQPGMAIVAPLENGSDGLPKWALRLRSQREGGWVGEGALAFEGVELAEGQLRTESLGGGAHALWWRTNLESLKGGHLAWGQASLFARHQGVWAELYQGPTERRWQAGFADEVAQSAQLRLADVDGDGLMELLREDFAYLRRLDAKGKGIHVAVEALGAWVHQREASRFELRALEAQGRTWRSRQSPPLVAVRAREGVMRIDGDFGDWEAQEAANALALKLDSLDQLTHKKRDRKGIDDFAGELALAYDAQALYLRAMVADNKTVPCPEGARMYEGDHMVAWLDADLEGDFDEEKANADDWGLGFGVGLYPGRGVSHLWLPAQGMPMKAKCAWAPLRDPHSGGRVGHQLEAAIPWAMVGISPPPLAQSSAEAIPTPIVGQVKHLRLKAQAMLGLGLALADADDAPQELAYGSSPRLAWAKPTSLNPLVLAEAHLSPAPMVSTP